MHGGGRPEIVEEVQNITVALGRDATLKCYVKHLADYKVIKQGMSIDSLLGQIYQKQIFLDFYYKDLKF